MSNAPRRSATGSILIVALVAFAIVGVAALASLSASLTDFVASLISPSGQRTLAGYWLLVVVPAGLPMTLVGAWLVVGTWCWRVGSRPASFDAGRFMLPFNMTCDTLLLSFNRGNGCPRPLRRRKCLTARSI